MDGEFCLGSVPIICIFSEADFFKDKERIIPEVRNSLAHHPPVNEQDCPVWLRRGV